MRFERTEQLVLDIQMIVAELMQLSSCDTMFGREDIFNDLLERHNRVANCINEPPYYSISIVRELEENAGNDVSKLTDLFKLWKNRLDKIKIPKDEWFSEISFWLDGDDKHLRAFQIAHNVKTYTEIINDAVTQFCRDNDINCDYVDLWQQDEPQDSENNSSLAACLADGLNTQKAQNTFAKAIAKGWMRQRIEGGFEWLGIDGKKSKAQLAYLCAKVYGYQYKAGRGNVGDNVPYDALERLFDVTRLDRAMQQVFEAKRPQRWRQKIDQIITE